MTRRIPNNALENLVAMLDSPDYTKDIKNAVVHELRRTRASEEEKDKTIERLREREARLEKALRRLLDIGNAEYGLSREIYADCWKLLAELKGEAEEGKA